MTKRNGNVSESMAELFKAIEEIDKMIGVVRDISTKTDLLALNASIEAARAGHAGKGFAIVAHEVARLSEKAQESIGVVEAACGNLKRNINVLSQELSKEAKAA
ncbi:MAG: methyl-accepting chemotaxis protein [Bdellovibrionota bacterium]